VISAVGCPAGALGAVSSAGGGACFLWQPVTAARAINRRPDAQISFPRNFSTSINRFKEILLPEKV
jgi:hypothetical protein